MTKSTLGQVQNPSRNQKYGNKGIHRLKLTCREKFSSLLGKSTTIALIYIVLFLCLYIACMQLSVTNCQSGLD